MRKIKIVISGADRLDCEYISSFSPELYEVLCITNPKPTDEEVIAALQGASIYVLGGEEVLTESMLNEAHALRLVACLATSAHLFVDIEAADRLGIAVACTPNLTVMYEAMSEYLLGMIIGLRRKIAYSHNQLKAGRVSEITAPLLKDSVIGIVGMGRVGTRFSDLLYSAFGCKIVYSANSDKPTVEHKNNAERLELCDLLRVSDIVVLACSYNVSTRGIIGARELASMKSGALLVNTTCAALVDGAALYDSLLNGTLAGAAFDDKNWDQVPIVKDGKMINMPIELMKFSEDKFLCTPYVGALTPGVWQEMSQVAFSTVHNYLSQGTDECLVNINIDEAKAGGRGGC